MGRILRFLSRHSNIFLFLFLELVAFLLVVNVNQDQSRAFSGITQEVTARIHNVRSGVTGYFDLSKQNAKLMERNRELQLTVIDLKTDIDAMRHKVPYKDDYTILPDSMRPETGFDFIGCRTINYSFHLNYNYITLNKGSKHGVQKGMGVISSEGIVGMVISVSPRFSVAISALNQSFNLSTRLQKSRHLGTLTWNGKNPEIASLKYIPQTTDLEVGDLVVTSAVSTIFPEGFYVGKVKEFNKESHDGFYNIEVELATDFRSLDHLFVVRNEFKAEIDSLEQSSIPQ